ncbi:hypothetical protein TCAL_00871 [Tigriopus californicus]|uniref:Very-long-chain (3R)-3-hydroxyacyl-CoA dehydratase n=1 Tax=Tigriopus californicus TaxID=6832 RepID=A0A553NBI7_TIGCA|nr:very-long-chain (3R)-3-hydroxyacyl-CoA dehydratase 2-like [Tigriopus californicus]TRY62800.1 hypothetical protein TCAL_00871 [Tigriopus californicus]|eukprot:TCALIF_00871-PA protein Name:"Similar to PTPLB Very-long-chain (3R)-3-hydroxyacyl-[acyl-carrier protein] dehydratase 2 (Homo sapiens)" AED:0.08 eAED:0.08 QI:0/-1/0/1/-1/1/1/0/227
MGVLVRSYLILYNVAQCLGWTWLLTRLAPECTRLWAEGSTAPFTGQLYAAIELPLKVFQTAAVLEIVHALVGLVRSNPLLTAFQVFSRVFVTWAVVHSVPEAQTCPGLPCLLWAWVITEIIRYAYYAGNLLGWTPYAVVWLRYTLFIGLYPLGVTGELWCSYVSLARIQRQGLYTVSLPNAWNVTFNYYVVLILIMFSYIPIFPQLYLHMFRQRKKVLYGGATLKKE